MSEVPPLHGGFDHEGEMVAIAWLIAHAVVGATRTIATVELFIFEEELGGMDEGRVHLIIYRARSEDMIDALPLALIAVCASDTVFPSGISRKIIKTMTVNLLEDVAIRAVVEVAGYDEVGIRRDGMDGVYRLAKAICNGLTEGTAVTLATIATGEMDDEDMKRVT